MFMALTSDSDLMSSFGANLQLSKGWLMAALNLLLYPRMIHREQAFL